MQLTDEQQKHILDHLQKNWTAKTCPLCMEIKWSINTNVFEMREYFKEKIVYANNTVFPVIPIVCGNCGYTILINTIKAGITL